MPEPHRINGFHDLQDIREDVHYIKDNLSLSIDRLAVSVSHLTIKLDSFLRFQKKAVPLSVVGWMFFILSATILGIKGGETFIAHLTGK